MTEKELNAARELYEQLVAYFDVSYLQPAIEKGDELHMAICDYREDLPIQHLPSGEAEFMLDLLDLSRSDDIDNRRGSQKVAIKWVVYI